MLNLLEILTFYVEPTECETIRLLCMMISLMCSKSGEFDSKYPSVTNIIHVKYDLYMGSDYLLYVRSQYMLFVPGVFP